MTTLLLHAAVVQASPPEEASKSDLAYRVGRQHMDAGRFEDALKEFTALVDAEPHNPDYLVAKGAALKCTGQIELSRQAFLSALEIDPEHIKALRNLAIVTYQLERFAEAIEVCDSYLERDDSADILVVKAICCYCLSRFDQSLLAVETAHKSAPGRSDILAIEALALAESGQSDAARQTCGELIRRAEGNRYFAHLALGNLHFREGRLDEAVKEYARAIQHGPKEPHALANRGLCKCAQKDYAGALADLDAALERKSVVLPFSGASALLAKAYCYDRTGDQERAVECVSHVLNLAPQHVNALAYRAVLHGKLGGISDMKRDLESLIDLGELGDMPSYFLLSALLWDKRSELQDHVRATQLAKDLVEKGEVEYRPHYQSLLAKCYKLTGEENRSLELKAQLDPEAETRRPRFRLQLGQGITLDDIWIVEKDEEVATAHGTATPR